jgi:hypothetical protein
MSVDTLTHAAPGMTIARRRPTLWIGLLAIALALPGLWIDRPMFAASWLAAWWWSLSIVLGAQTLAWIHRLSGGRWGEVLLPVIGALGRTLPVIVVLFIPVALMLPDLYPWAADPAGWSQGLARPGFVHAWLATGPFLVRMVIYAVAWLFMTRGTTPSMRSGRAAVSLIGYVVLTSLAAVDLLASLVPGWSSSVFGLLALVGQLLGGSAMAVTLTAALRSATVPLLKPPEPPLWRDFGNLLLMGVSLWGYLAFMQFLVIWAENLPREISWFVPRLQTGWHAIGVAVIAANLALPLAALLMRSLKDKPGRLALIAFGLVVAQALDAVWMVLPSVDAHSLHGWWLAPLLFIGFGLVVFGGLPAAVYVSASRGDAHGD